MKWVVIRNNYINYETNALINSKGIVIAKKKLKVYQNFNIKF